MWSKLESFDHTDRVESGHNKLSVILNNSSRMGNRNENQNILKVAEKETLCLFWDAFLKKFTLLDFLSWTSKITFMLSPVDSSSLFSQSKSVKPPVQLQGPSSAGSWHLIEKIACDMKILMRKSQRRIEYYEEVPQQESL